MHARLGIREFSKRWTSKRERERRKSQEVYIIVNVRGHSKYWKGKTPNCSVSWGTPGRLSWLSFWPLILIQIIISAQVTISGSWDWAACRAPCSVGSLHLHCPLPLSWLCTLSLTCSLSQINKILNTHTHTHTHKTGPHLLLFQTEWQFLSGAT